MDFLLLTVNSLNFILICYLLMKVSPPTADVHPTPHSDEHLTEYEKEKIESDRLFDERIEKLKNELALYTVQGDIVRKGVPAQEMHPGVKNIPHNAVKYKDEEEEYAY